MDTPEVAENADSSSSGWHWSLAFCVWPPLVHAGEADWGGCCTAVRSYGGLHCVEPGVDASDQSFSGLPLWESLSMLAVVLRISQS